MAKKKQKTVAYLRVSTNHQDVESQELEIRRYAEQRNIKVDEYIRVEMSTRRSKKERRINDLMLMLNQGDTLIVSELTRLGRSLGEVAQTFEKLNDIGVRLISIKEDIDTDGKKPDLTLKIKISMFCMFADMERHFISERTKRGLETAKKRGVRLGRPPGPGKSKLDGKEDEIKALLEKKISKAGIARIMDVSRTAMWSFIKRRGLER